MIPRSLVLKLAATLLLSAALLTGLSVPLGPLPPLGGLLVPHGGFWTVAEGAVPVTRQTLTFPGLEAPVQVYRDDHYVPHVYAAGDEDLYRAVGYLHAQDRLFQMDLQRRAATGNLSEVLGPETLATDRFFRSIGMNWAVEQTLAKADNETLAVLEAYAEGVNAYLAAAGSRGLPLEFKLLNYAPRPWTPADSVAFAKLMGWSLSGTFEDLELQLFVDAYGLEAAEELFPVNVPTEHPVIPPGPSSPPGPPGAVSPAPSEPALSREAAEELLAWWRGASPVTSPLEMPGSNNWVVGPDRSATGAPLLANDPHLRLDLPSLWYQMHLVSPSLNVYGVTLAAAPVVVLGFNERVAWGFTNVGADVVDFFVERINTANPEQYRHEGQWKTFQQRVEVIPVRGEAPVTLPINISVHGPVIESHGQRVAIQWTGHLPTFEIRALLNMNRAQSAAEFREALEDWHVPAQNVVYADVAGTIGIAVNGLYPVRGNNSLGRLPMNGSSGEFDWEGFMPMDSVPNSTDPLQGFLLSANQKPTRQNDPYLGWSWADGYRAARIHEVLDESEALTVDDMKALQLDHLSVAAREFVPILLEAYAAAGPVGPTLHDKAEDAIGLLEDWDFVMDRDRVEPSVYWLWLRNFREATFRDEWDAEGLEAVRLPSVTVLERLSKDDPSSPWFDDVTTPEAGESRSDVALRAFVETLEWLEEEMGTNWRWGLLHRIQLRHLIMLDALSSLLLPRSGGSFTVDVAHGSFDGNRLLVTTGASWRLVAELRTTIQAHGIHPGGQSGNPLSPHYQDLFGPWMDGAYLELALPEEEAFQSTEPDGGRY